MVNDKKPPIVRKRLRTPRAASVAGILFALCYGTSVVLIRLTVPSVLTPENVNWLEVSPRKVSLALNLVPYAGIAFLWFIGVIRDRFGELEDRFFSTVFLGSGLVYLALIFVGAALAGGLITTYAEDPALLIQTGVYSYSRAAVYNLLNVYAIRMAGVFMISLGTIWFRTQLMQRKWAILTYTLALILLLSISYSVWVSLLFPLWVLTVSVYYLMSNLRMQITEAE